MDGEVEVPKAKRAESRRQRAWELRCQGLSYPSIAKAIGCSQSTAWELVHRTEEEAHKLLAEAALQAKVEHLGQLEAVKEQAALAYRRDGKPQSLSVILKTIELERKVLGLDKAQDKAEGDTLTGDDILRELEAYKLAHPDRYGDRA